jgi:hypothetical protein
LTAVDLLQLDDVGAEQQTEWVLEQLYAIVNERYEDGKALMITTNLEGTQLIDQIGQRTVSRLIEVCGDPLQLYGRDRRIALSVASSASSRPSGFRTVAPSATCILTASTSRAALKLDKASSV